MGLFPQQFIDDLRVQANVLQIVQEYVPLKRSGATYKGLCPFHGEKTPSFHVNPDKGFFHCFGCGVGGDIFKFLELYEKIGFQEAVRLLAQKLGIPVPEPSSEGGSDDAALREALLKIHETAAAFFTAQLDGPAGVRARQQLASRGVPEAVRTQLGLGFAPSGRDRLKDHVLAAGYPLTTLLQSGLVVRRDSGEVVDRFRNRLMIPICRDSGAVVAFGGRAMDADQVPKYLNSPETPIYSKGRTLYGLNLTKSGIRTLGYAVIVEGYFDFAQVFLSQAAPVVASCGTALTPQQAKLLRRFTSKVVLCYDPDAAGQNAAVRSCDLLVAEGFDVNVAMLEAGQDPDTFIRESGPERYRERLRQSRPYLEYLLDKAAEDLDFGHGEGRREFMHRMLEVAAKIPDATARDQFADRIAHKAQVTEEVVRAEIRRAAAGRKTTLTERELPAYGTLKAAEKGLIWNLVHDSLEGQAALDSLDADDLRGLAGRGIFELARSLHREGQLPSALLQRLSTEDAQLVTSIAAGTSPPAPALECARALKRVRWERERAEIQREIDRLQEIDARRYGNEIDALWQKKKNLLLRMEE